MTQIQSRDRLEEKDVGHVIDFTHKVGNTTRTITGILIGTGSLGFSVVKAVYFENSRMIPTWRNKNLPFETKYIIKYSYDEVTSIDIGCVPNAEEYLKTNWEIFANKSDDDLQILLKTGSVLEHARSEPEWEQSIEAVKSGTGLGTVKGVRGPELDDDRWNDFEAALESLLNRHCIDNECETPDFLLAEKVVADLRSQATLTKKRESWHGRGPKEASTATQEKLQ